MLVNSAVKHPLSHYVYIGKRHFEIFKMHRNGNLKGGIQGFVDSAGKFYNREEALKYAIECGQIKSKTDLIGSRLTSEDLW